MLYGVRKTTTRLSLPPICFSLNFFPLPHPTSASCGIPTGPAQATCLWGICWSPNLYPMPLYSPSCLELQPASQGESWATWAGEGVSLCGCSYWARRQQKHSRELGQIHFSLGLVFNLWLHWCAAVDSEIKVSYCAQKGIRSGGSSRSKS